ncbi:MAG TPA: sn-glycerol-3-phosphate ABC transporter ATP-binding protein UgpC [Gaiellaceae bacterium]|nr:sn-glycerol-3-phosphate ABC transporter ATP-binding protein UgpC [Gaiellaceae bacterium]
MAAVSFERVTKVFENGEEAVRELSLGVQDGEFIVLVGPSGSGKSTALRMVAGLEEATEGTIRIGERVVNDVAPRDRDIAMVFQNYALYPHMSVRENIGFPLRLHGVRRREVKTRVGEATELLGIGELLERRPRQLSGGQRQRVAMGRSIVREPRAFLMDEPLSNLDAKLRVEMRAYIGRLHQQLGTTTLYVTHDQTEAMTMADRVAVMRDGRLEQVDQPQAVYERPANVFVAGFIGSPAMNLLRSRLEASNGALHTCLGEHRLLLPDRPLRWPGLGRYVGRDVVVGLRPEAISNADDGEAAGTTIDVEVALAEPLGAETIVHFDVEGADALKARLDGRTRVSAGERVRLAVDVERLHFFDPETERAIS